ncbi:MAG: hypothetical protein ABIB71_09520 [Candidatus Woesearchaeota archaeon]
MEEPVGKITHFFGKIGVAVIALSGDLKSGDKIKIGEGEEAFEQDVSSMQVEHQNIADAKAGQEIGIKLDKPTKVGALVYKL